MGGGVLAERSPYPTFLSALLEHMLPEWSFWDERPRKDLVYEPSSVDNTFWWKLTKEPFDGASYRGLPNYPPPP